MAPSALALVPTVTLDRKSSQAFAMKLFGGLIGWRANKQDTVTTSTTEAELLALAQAAKETLFVSRLLTELSVDLDNKQIKIECDNTQTIKLVNSEVTTLKTKLRHVDIHHIGNMFSVLTDGEEQPETAAGLRVSALLMSTGL